MEMQTNTNTKLLSRLSSPKWLLLGGLIISVAFYVIWSLTGNRISSAVLVLVGSFTIPVAVMVFIFSRLNYQGGIPAKALANCFMLGGAAGLIAAGFLELNIPLSQTLGGDIGVGLIEESVKLIFPMALFLGWRYKRLSDGFLIGAASGMGFAVLETLGKALVVLDSGGNVGYTLLTRGFFTPFGHPAWTALICAFLWSEKLNSKFNVAKVFGVFLLAVALHAIWDGANQLNVPDIATASLLVAISMITMSLLFFKFEKAEKESNGV